MAKHADETKPLTFATKVRPGEQVVLYAVAPPNETFEPDPQTNKVDVVVNLGPKVTITPDTANLSLDRTRIRVCLTWPTPPAPKAKGKRPKQVGILDDGSGTLTISINGASAYQANHPIQTE